MFAASGSSPTAMQWDDATAIYVRGAMCRCIIMHGCKTREYLHRIERYFSLVVVAVFQLLRVDTAGVGSVDVAKRKLI